jgi:hypothetical protein
MERADDVAAARVPKQPSKVEADHDDYVDGDVVEAAPVEAEAAPAPPAPPALPERDLAVLAFERLWWRRAGSKEQAIREEFGVSTTRYYQLLNALLDNPAALAHDPVLVKRLRRVRAAGTRSRGSTAG